MPAIYDKTKIPTAKVDLVTRLIAMLIDGVVAAIASQILFFILNVVYLGFIGYLVGAAYLLVRDTIFDGKSLGKKIMNLQAVNYETGAAVTMNESVMRNLPIAAGLASGAIGTLPIPYVAALLGMLAGLAAFGLAVYDLYVFFTDSKNHRRWGDILGHTIVVPLGPSAVAEEEEVEVEEEVGS